MMPTFHTGDPTVDILSEGQVDQIITYLKSQKLQ